MFPKMEFNDPYVAKVSLGTAVGSRIPVYWLAVFQIKRKMSVNIEKEFSFFSQTAGSC